MSNMVRVMAALVCTAAVSVLAGVGGAATSGVGTAVKIEQSGDAVAVVNGGEVLRVSLEAPRLVFDGVETAGGIRPASVEGELSTGDRVKVSFDSVPLGEGESVDVTLYVEWSPKERILRKWAEVRLNAAAPRLLYEVALDTLPLDGQAVEFNPMPPQSYPAFLTGFFAGIEFPIASTRIENDRLLLAHRPGVALEPGKTYTTRKAVYGAAPAGREAQAFKDYIARHRPTPTGLHVNYNSWWTSSVPFTEGEILGIMASFEENLFKPYGVALDTFTIDLGWSDSQSLWEISRERFPQGFSAIQRATERMNAHLGLWISPTCFYSPAAVDTEWAEGEGYETTVLPWGEGQVRVCCLGGPKYAGAFRDRLVQMLTEYGIRHVKLDGYFLTCNVTDHGHAAGPLSSEAIAEGGIAAFDAMHAAVPDVWLEATCFGWNPSPWWLFHVNSVIGTFGDDAPHGRVPAPVYRESYTTARDYFNLQGAARLNVPIVAQEVLGLIHQTDEPFLNDAVDVILRGHAFLTMYVNPKYMNDGRWKALAACIDWARKNPLVFEHTEPILPASWQEDRVPRFTNDEAMPREPYGYAHWNGTQGLVALRNPWIAPATVSVKVGGHEGLAEAPEAVSAVSLYPEPRVYGRDLARGDVLEVPLAPYETVVLSFKAEQPLEGIPEAKERVGGQVEVLSVESKVARVEYEKDGPTHGPDWTALTLPGSSTLALDLEARVRVETDARLLILLEGMETPAWPVKLRCEVDGAELTLRRGSNDAGWAASSIPAGTERWQFIEGDLPAGEHRVSLSMAGSAGCSGVSVWAYATRPGGGFSDYPNALPSPELISLDAAPLQEPIDADSVTDTERRPVEIERIDGVYLDALEPVSATQGWGELQRNRSVTETLLNIGGRRFLRGLGTHAVSRIVYDLKGEYRRFQAWAGANSGSHATVTFEVWADGEKVWESGPVAATDEARPVDIDVTGVQRLELVVGDGGNGIGADHANWGDARLLR